MPLFERNGNALECWFRGELLRVEPWGDNSIRVRSRPGGDLLEPDYALLPQEEAADCAVTVGETSAELRCGKLRLTMEELYGRMEPQRQVLEMRFYNPKGELLLSDPVYPLAMSKKRRAGLRASRTAISSWRSSSSPTRTRSSTAWGSISRRSSI